MSMITVFGQIRYGCCISVAGCNRAIMAVNCAKFPTDPGWFWLEETGPDDYYTIIAYLRDKDFSE